MDDAERRALLFPPWAQAINGRIYNETDDEGKRLWRQERGQQIDAEAFRAWTAQLADAVQAGNVSQLEAESAIKRGMRHVD